MARFLLDTDAVIDFVRGIPTTVSLLNGLREQGEYLCVSDVVIAEVHSGLHRGDQERVRRLLLAFTFLSTGPDAAERAGQWRYQFARRGVTLSVTDALVAATAHAHSATIVTGNLRDYPMDEVTLLPLPRAGRQS